MYPTLSSRDRTANRRRTLVRLVSAVVLSGSLLGFSATPSNAAPPPDYQLDTHQPANQPPVTEDDHYTTPVDTILDIADPGILGNDHDPDGSVLTTYTESPVHPGGVMYRRSDGSFRFEPADGFVGTETFEYWAIDSDGAHTTGTMTIEVVGDDELDVDDSCPDRSDCLDPEDDTEDSRDGDHADPQREPEGELAEAPQAPARVEIPTYTG